MPLFNDVENIVTPYAWVWKEKEREKKSSFLSKRYFYPRGFHPTTPSLSTF